MKLSKFSVCNYKLLSDVALELPGLTVLIGANGSGKTTILDALQLLSESSSSSLGEAVSRRGGIDGLFSRHVEKQDPFDELSFRLEANTFGEPLIYELTITERHGNPVVSAEKLSQVQKGLGTPPFLFLSRNRRQTVFRTPGSAEGFLKLEVPDDRLALEIMPITHRTGEEFRQLLKNVQYNSGFDVGLRSAIRLPQDARSKLFPGEQGEMLFPCLHNYRVSREDAFDYLLDVIRAGFPSFRKMEFPIPADRKMSLNWYDQFSRQPFDQSELSDGTLRFLWLIAVLLSPEKPRLILLDEPEISLHPHLLRLLADVMRNSSQDSQIVVATHSDQLIRALSPEEVVTVDKAEAGSVFKRLSAESLHQWLSDYSLDQLWNKKIIGGQV